MTKTQLKKYIKENQVIADIDYQEVGKGRDGFPIFEIAFKNPPINHKLVKLYENIQVAILEDLDYEAKQNSTL